MSEVPQDAEEVLAFDGEVRGNVPDDRPIGRRMDSGEFIIPRANREISPLAAYVKHCATN